MSRYTADRASSLLTPLAYDPKDKLFFLSDKTIGFGYLCQPLSGADTKVKDRLGVLLNDDWPTDTILQISMVSSPDIQPEMMRMRSLRLGQEDSLMRETVEERARFLMECTQKPVDTRTGLLVRDFWLVVTCKIPFSGDEPSEREIERMNKVRLSLLQGLDTVGLAPEAMTRHDYLQTMSCILNHGENATWRQPGRMEADDDKMLRDQVFDYDTDLRVDNKGLWLGKTRVTMLSVKRYPQRIHFGHAASYIGDVMQGVRGIRGPFMITATIHFPSPPTVKDKLGTKRQWTINQCYGPMLKFLPVLAQKKEDFDVLYQAFEDGHRPARLYLSVGLFNNDIDSATMAVSNLMSYWGELGFHLLPDNFFALPFFLNSLPFGADRVAMNDLMRYKTMATKHIVPLLPIFADWKGTGTASMQFISRNGQLINNCLFDSGSNYNTCIAAQSGSGKSFLVNDIISSYLSQNGRCWVIDVGRSYEKLCQAYDGEFIHFGPDSDICLNPFQIIRDYEEESDVLAGLVAAMAAPTQPLSDFQMANLKRVMRLVWEDKKHQMTVDDLAKALLAADEDPRVRDVGHQLYSFTADGEYGKYFVGENNISFKNRFNVLELEELKGRVHLQQVVLLQLIFQIQQEMYLGVRDRRKIVIVDEAWDLLTKGEVAIFIEHGYRRFRKYGGSAITVTQSVMDLYETKAGRAIAENSANMFLLGQKAEAINALKNLGRLPLSDGGYDLLKTVHTIPGLYSEIFFLTDYGAGIGRLMVEPFRRLLYSTKAEDVNAIRKKQVQGMSITDAVYEVMKDRQSAEMR